MALVKELEHLSISFDIIKLATNDFDAENFIGIGGFGKVYKGQISDKAGLTKTVAVKRLDRRHGQGDHEFLTEIMMLSRYQHKNLVSLIGFCDEGDEKILVYEYAFHGSLEKYLSSNALTWPQRLVICIGAGGLEYLHNPLGTQQRVLHRDVKSANVLIDQYWEAKISDFGLSRIGPANQEFTFLVSNAVGTFGYCDPLYAETGILTKESDVYSFGVVLFEVLCGRLCNIKHDERQHRLLTQLARHSYEKGTIDEIIFQGIREQMEPNSLKTFSSVAYRCLQRDREERPTMAEVVSELEFALEYQESYESGKPMEYEEIVQMADGEHPLVYSNRRELKLLLSSGILVDWGRRWFSLSKSQHNCEMISASEFSFQDPETIQWIPHPKSRFPEVAKASYERELDIEVDVETMFLSPGITYAAYLVFRYCDYDDDKDDDDDSDVEESQNSCEPTFVGLQYKLKELGESSISYFADLTDNGWMIIELCQFNAYKKAVKLELLLDSFFDYSRILFEGIQFLPVEKAINQESIEDDDTYTRKDKKGEQKLPSDYRHIVKMAKDHVPYNITSNELYVLLSNGILTKKGQIFFFLDKDGVKCCMQAATSVLEVDNEETNRFSHTASFRGKSLRESTRFEKVAECVSGRDFDMKLNINLHILSPNTTYATYLVYKLPKTRHVSFEYPLKVEDPEGFSSSDNKVRFIFLISPKTPVIMSRNDDQKPEKKPLNRPKMEGIAKERKDGWMEVEIWAFTTDATTSSIYKNLNLSPCDNGAEELTGLIVQGVEIRPK